MKDDAIKCRVEAKEGGGTEINTLDAWLQHGGPKEGEKQWHDFRSAKELAKAWLRHSSPKMPVEYAELLSRRSETRGFRPTLAIAEVSIAIDGFAGPRNSDMVVIGDAGQSRVVLAVEAKADEQFAGTTDDELRRVTNPDSNKPERIDNLSAAVLSKPVDDLVRSLRYQHLVALDTCHSSTRGIRDYLSVVRRWNKS